MNRQRWMHLMSSLLMSSLLLIVLLVGCGTVPLTGRRQLTLVNDAELATMSAASYQEVITEAELADDQEQIALVRKVGEALAAATETYLTGEGISTDGYEWEFNVIKDDETVNAWCMPGGKIAVYTGILPITEDENGLAVVMSHEIAHAVARHGNERMSQQMMIAMGGAALSKALAETPEKKKELFLGMYGLGSNVGLMLPYNRHHEREADRIGLTIMAMAGYDPRGAVPFWERMGEVSGGRPPEFLSTHPGPGSRVEKIKEHLPEALKHYKK